MNIVSTVQAGSGLTGQIGLTIIDLDSRSTILARTITNITEISPQVYVWEGDVADTDNWVEIWDTGGVTPQYSYTSYGVVPTVQAPSGLVNTISIEIINPVTNTVWLATTTSSIAELISGSGVYAYTGATVPFSPFIAVWTAIGQTVRQEIGETLVNIVSSIDAPTGLTGQIGIRIIDAATGATLLNRTTSGIIEDVTGVYVWQGSIASVANRLEIWDTGGGAPQYQFNAVGNIPSVQTRPGLVGTLSLKVIDPTNGDTWLPETTDDIVEVFINSGIYRYAGPQIGLDLSLAIWNDGTSVIQQELGPPIVIESQPSVRAPILSYRNVGGRRTPQEIKRLRRENMDFCRRMGESVILKHQYNNRDYLAGQAFLDNGGIVTKDTDPMLAKHCPACWDDERDMAKNTCKVCFGVGFVSLVYDDITHKLIENGKLSDVDLGSHQRAPKYGGYGPGFITWMVEPDVAVDVFRINEQGVMVQTENAQGVAPWYPDLGDNDLCINVELDRNLQTIIDIEDRFQLKLTNPNTVRGFGRRGIFQNYKVSQQFAMARIPENTVWYDVPVDR